MVVNWLENHAGKFFLVKTEGFVKWVPASVYPGFTINIFINNAEYGIVITFPNEVKQKALSEAVSERLRSKTV